MGNRLKKIDVALLAAITNSEFSQIDYENLLANDPAKIRDEELKLSLKALPEVPQQLKVENIWIPSADQSGTIRLRLYRPKGKENLPILLYFHGGAFIYGTPEQYDSLFFPLALDIGALVVSVDYRLAPEHPFPAGMEDGYDTLLWLSEHASDIGGDKDNILIGGSSAGATIAAAITHMARDRREVEIRHQYLLYPPTSHLLETRSMKELANAPMQSRKAAEWMWKYYLNDKTDPLPKYAVPLLEQNFNDLPDATVIVCELDPLKDEGKAYAAKLEKAGVRVTMMEMPGAVHAFDFFPCPLSDHFYKYQVELFKQILNQKK